MTQISQMKPKGTLPSSAARFPLVIDGDPNNYNYDLAADLAARPTNASLAAAFTAYPTSATLATNTGAGLLGFLSSLTYTAGSVGAYLKTLLGSTGSTLVGFLQNGTGAVARTAQDKLRETVSVTDFGADPTGVADSLAAFNLAFATGKAVVMPEGTFSLSAYPTATTGSFALSGAGKSRTTLLISHNGARGLYFTPASVNNRVELSGFTMQANFSTGPCPLGIEIAFPSASSYPYRQVSIDVDFRGNLAVVSPWADTWGRGIRLTNVWYPLIRANGSSAPIAGDTGNTGFLEVTGGSYGMVGANISAVWYYGADFVRGSAYMEGIYFDNCEAVGVTRGLYVPATTAVGGAAATYRAAFIFFRNSNIAAQSANFDLDNVLALKTVDNTNQRWADASATNWTGFKLNNVLYPQIIGGSISGNDASGGITTLGISAAAGNSAHGIVSGVHFENLDTQFNLDSFTSHWTVRSNVATGSTPDVFVQAGTNHDIEWLNTGGFIQRSVNGLSFSGSVYSAVGELGKVNAAGVTYTAAEILSDAIFRSGAATVSDTTPTAAQIVAAIPGAVVGTGKRITINNQNSGVLTLVAGTGVTLVSTTSVTNATARNYLIRITNATPGSEAVRLIGLQTGSI